MFRAPIGSGSGTGRGWYPTRIPGGTRLSYTDFRIAYGLAFALLVAWSSVAVERVFNVGRDVIGLRRYSLKPETFTALMLGKYMIKQ